jgi:predicted amidohydrolase YtcJ
MPGLIDSHSHAIFGGLEMVAANMEDEVVELDELENACAPGVTTARPGMAMS